MADSHMLELGRKILASQPFNAFLGAELLSLAEGAAELSVPQLHAMCNGTGHDRQACDASLTRNSYRRPPRPRPVPPRPLIRFPSRYMTLSMKYWPSDSVRDSSM